MPYANLEYLIADYLPEATKEEEIAALGRILENVSAFVDSHCRRPSGFFSANDTASMKRVRGEGERFLRLPVHQFGTIDEVATSYGTVIDSSRYYESEKNGWLYAEDSLYPEASFDLCSQNGWADECTFKVTAKWGYAATPKPVEEFCRLATKSVWESQQGTLGQISPVGFALKAQLFPPDLLLLLKEFVKREFEV